MVRIGAERSRKEVKCLLAVTSGVRKVVELNFPRIGLEPRL